MLIVKSRTVPTKATVNRLNQKRTRQRTKVLVATELREYWHEPVKDFPALALLSGSPTLMSLS